MSDSFHHSVNQIIHLLKRSPGSITIANIQRLANIYKLESFPEVINAVTNLKRLSIAGKILVMDIDYYDAHDEAGAKQGRITIEDVKLILANDNNEFGCVNSVTGDNILINCLTKYSNLSKFDNVLTQLSTLDNYTQDSMDLFGEYVKIYQVLKEKNQGDVILNYDDELCILVLGKFKLSLIHDEETTFNGATEIALHIQTINTVNGIDKDLLVPVDELHSNFFNLHFNEIEGLLQGNHNKKHTSELQMVKLLTTNETYRSKKRSEVTLQGFELLPRGVAKLPTFNSSDLTRTYALLYKICKFNLIVKVIKDTIDQFESVDKFEELENEDLTFEQFLSSPATTTTQDHSMTKPNNEDIEMTMNDEDSANNSLFNDLNDVNSNTTTPSSEPKFISVTLCQNIVEIKSDISSLNQKFDIGNENESIEEFTGNVMVLREIIVSEGIL